MEDVDLLRRARKIEKIKKLKKHVIVSSRRFESVGIIKTQIKSLVYILRFLSGTNPRELYSKYYYNQDERRKGRNHFRQIPGIREGENTFSLSNE